MKTHPLVRTVVRSVTFSILCAWLVSCSNTTAPFVTVAPPPTDNTKPLNAVAALRGGAWYVESLRNGSASYPAVRSMQLFREPSISFRDSSAGGNSSCNGFGGELRVWGSDSLTVRNIAATQIACSDPSGMFENAFFDALEQTVRYTFPSVTALVLHTASGGEIRFSRNLTSDTSFAAQMVNMTVIDYINHPYTMQNPAFILGDTMYAEVAFSGCRAQHTFSLFINNSYGADDNVDMLYGDLIHHDDEACQAYFTRRLAIDLSPVKKFWQNRTGKQHGTIYLNLPARVSGGKPLPYSF
ncbi:MAG: META domain-containing protein [Candidatus Kapabacteria bacterium]|nr:META domain-containing protein [Candidatus Kapabacteria bacterium]